MIDQIFYLCGGAALGAAAYGIYWASKPDAYVDARITYEDWVNSLPLHDQMKVYRIHKSKLGAARAPFSEFEIQMLTNEYNEMKAAEAMAINYEDYRPADENVAIQINFTETEKVAPKPLKKAPSNKKEGKC